MRNYNEETLAELLRSLSAPPEAWVRAAQEIPLARRDLEQALQDAGYDADPALAEAVRERLSS